MCSATGFFRKSLNVFLFIHLERGRFRPRRLEVIIDRLMVGEKPKRVFFSTSVGSFSFLEVSLGYGFAGFQASCYSVSGTGHFITTLYPHKADEVLWWSSNTGVSICCSPLEKVAFEFVLTSPALLSNFRSSYMDGLRDGR